MNSFSLSHKIKICLITAVTALTASSFAGSVGEYQMYRASIYDKVQGKNVDKLFMVNTTNGKSWELDQVLDDTGDEKKIISGWRTVEKDIADEEQKVKDKKSDLKKSAQKQESNIVKEIK